MRLALSKSHLLCFYTECGVPRLHVTRDAFVAGGLVEEGCGGEAGMYGPGVSQGCMGQG